MNAMRLRVCDGDFLDDLIAACRDAGIDARREGGCVVVTPSEPEPGAPPEQPHVEALFFVRSWALRRPPVSIQAIE